MKALFTTLIMLSCILILMNVACKKNNPIDNIETNPDKDLNRIFVANDQVVQWPKTDCAFSAELNLNGEGIYQVNFNSIPKISGRLISGPNTPIVQIDTGFNLVSTLFKFSGLIIGAYEFEVSFDKKYGNFNKDTCRIFVDSLSTPPQENIFSKLNWIQLDGYYFQSSTIQIDGIYDKIPPGSAFKAFIKRENNANWEELQPGNTNGSYDYNFYCKKGTQTSKGEIVIVTHKLETDRPDIKILY